MLNNSSLIDWLKGGGERKLRHKNQKLSSLYLSSIAIASTCLCLWLTTSLVKEKFGSGGVINLIESKASSIDFDRGDKQRLFEQLEFMVWRQERRDLLARLSDLIRSDINATPFSARSWKELSMVSKFDGSSLNERVWILKNALRLNQWNDADRIYLTHQCIDQYEDFQREAEAFCDGLIRDLPKGTHLPVLANQLNVSVKRLTQVLGAEGLGQLINP